MRITLVGISLSHQWYHGFGDVLLSSQHIWVLLVYCDGQFEITVLPMMANCFNFLSLETVT